MAKFPIVDLTKDTPDLLDLAANLLTAEGGGTVHVVLDEAGDWSSAITFHGKAGAALGYGGTAREALNQALGVAYGRFEIKAVQDDA